MAAGCDRVAVVTGAGAGIGLAIAEALGRAGEAVVAVDRDATAAAEAADRIVSAGGAAAALALDIADPLAPERIDSFSRERLGIPAVLVNNAAAGGGEAFADVTPERYDRVFAVSARAAFFLTQALVPGMKAMKSGRIINISSLIAARGAAGNPHYAGAKAAMLGFTRSWAIELAPFGITVNTVLPALTDTPMARSAHGEAFLTSHAARVPAGRLGRPEDVAGVVQWLCSESASFLSGQAISPNGAEFVGAL
jgi:NAD(P)-dependent dehydrogenase (short-subunit alcohol dehydrogenase family)